MNEILAASSFGITRNEISDKWANSIKNDQNETEISERTFHRIKNDLMELFECEIICNPLPRDTRYRFRMISVQMSSLHCSAYF